MDTQRAGLERLPRWAASQLQPWHRPWKVFLLLFGFVHGAPSAGNRLAPRPISGALSGGTRICPGRDYTLLDHRVSADAAFAILNHFWITAPGAAADVTQIRYEIDDRAQPDIQFTPAMACGQGFPEEQADVGNGGLFSAGGKMGKASLYGGWYHNYWIPVYKRVIVSVRASANSTDCVDKFYALVRGFEELNGEDVIRHPSGVILPYGARMHVQTHDSSHKPLAWVNVARIPRGWEALLFLAVLVVESLHEGYNDYIKGCWHLYRTGEERFPGLVVGTGFEDFFDSAKWFSAAFETGPFEQTKARLFQHPRTGLMAFVRRGGRERLSAYRFFDEDRFGLNDGGRLEWRVGDEKGKCVRNTGDIKQIIGGVHSVRVASQMWLFVWPTAGPTPARDALHAFSMLESSGYVATMNALPKRHVVLLSFSISAACFVFLRIWFSTRTRRSRNVPTSAARSTEA